MVFESRKTTLLIYNPDLGILKDVSNNCFPLNMFDISRKNVVRTFARNLVCNAQKLTQHVCVFKH